MKEQEEINNIKEITMGDSSLNATEIAVGSLLANGRGNGAWGGYDHDHEHVFATDSSNAVRIDRNGDVATERSAGTRSIISNEFTAVRDAFNTINRADQINRICDSISQHDNRSSDQRFQSELRTNDRILALQAEINANAREAAKCCCDLKLQACEDKAQILSRMESLSKEGITRDLDRAERELIALRTQVACGCTTGCSRPCDK